MAILEIIKQILTEEDANIDLVTTDKDFLALTRFEPLRVEFNPRVIENNIKLTFGSGKLAKRATKPYIRALVLHELRHVWQFRNNKNILTMSQFQYMMVGSLGYGGVDCEKDANNYVVERFKEKSKFDKLIAKCFVYTQDMHGKFYRTKDDNIKGIGLYLGIAKYSLFPFLN